MHRTKSILNLGLFLAMAILALWFLTGCANPEKPLKYSTIHEAALHGDLEDVKNHLRRGAAVNAKGPYDSTPLHLAASSGQTKVAEYLIKKGANVNAEAGSAGERATPLEVAARFGFKDMVELLIKKGANIKKYGSNAITLATVGLGEKAYTKYSRGKLEVPPYVNLANMDHISVVKFLIKEGVKPEGKALFVAFEEHYSPEDIHRSIELIKLLIDGGADVNAKDKYGETLLHKAGGSSYVEFANAKFIEFLIKNGADVNAKDNYGNTPLRKAKSNKEVADFLRKHGAKE